MRVVRTGDKKLTKTLRLRPHVFLIRKLQFLKPKVYLERSIQHKIFIDYMLQDKHGSQNKF